MCLYAILIANSYDRVVVLRAKVSSCNVHDGSANGRPFLYGNSLNHHLSVFVIDYILGIGIIIANAIANDYYALLAPCCGVTHLYAFRYPNRVVAGYFPKYAFRPELE